MTNKHLTDVVFAQLGLETALVKAVNDLGFTHCTPIQARTLPLALTGQSIAGQAQTGTGKTAAFLLAALNDLLTIEPIEGRRPNEPRVLIIAPTRELVQQIYQDAKLLSKYTSLKIALAFGGVDYEEQRSTIQNGVDILIGTTGRLIDFYKQDVFGLDAIDVMIMDEADRMFDLGFIKDVRYLLRRMPPAEDRLNMLFSATLSHKVMELAYEQMNDPQKVQVDFEMTSGRIAESLYYPSKEELIPLLLALVKREQPRKAIVFVNTRRESEKVWGYLVGNAFSAGLLTGDVQQKNRLQLLTKLKNGEIDLLVATDVAARGLHIDDVTHVFNYDLPDDPEDYVHRIGRTARAGASGIAISFASEQTAMNLPAVEKYLKYSIPTASMNGIELVKPLPPKRLADKIARPKQKANKARSY